MELRATKLDERKTNGRPIGRKRAKVETKVSHAYYKVPSDLARVVDETQNHAKDVKEQNLLLASVVYRLHVCP